MYSDKRDDNEANLIELWRRAGCVTIQMSRDAGFDLVVISPRNGVHLVEVKMPGKYTLTKNERETCLDVEQVGGVYNIVQTDEQALELVEA